jgi:hypothetical protein
MKYSIQHIDKIYFIIEKQQPYNDTVEWVTKYFDNIITFTPDKYFFIIAKGDFSDESFRHNVRYQYGIEKSDKKFVFITHNDVLYKDDVIGNMLDNIGNCAGIGQIGMCWNCPAVAHCNGDKYKTYKADLDEVISISERNGYIRTLKNLNKEQLMPLPECRLNEWACLINREITVKECYPVNNTPLFGVYAADLGCPWFRSLVLKGYDFKNFNISKFCTHGYFAKFAGYPIQLNKSDYERTELIAKQFYTENYDK